MELREFPKVTLYNALQLLNALSPIVSSESDNVISFKLGHPVNASACIAVMPSCRVTEEIIALLGNAVLAISVVFAGMVT